MTNNVGGAYIQDVKGNLNSDIVTGLPLSLQVRRLLDGLLQQQGQQNGQDTGRQTRNSTVAAHIDR